MVEGDVQTGGRTTLLCRRTGLDPPPFRGVVLGIHVDVLSIVGNAALHVVLAPEQPCTQNRRVSTLRSRPGCFKVKYVPAVQLDAKARTKVEDKRSERIMVAGQDNEEEKVPASR